jgi:hypothetical protein
MNKFSANQKNPLFSEESFAEVLRSRIILVMPNFETVSPCGSNRPGSESYCLLKMYTVDYLRRQKISVRERQLR